MRQATARTAGGKFRQTVTIGPHTLISDEPLEAEGTDEGPSPHELLIAALASCTSMTVKLYADRKGWPLESVQATVTLDKKEGAAHMRCEVTLNGPLDDAQRQRLLEIANKCPVHRTLSGKIELESVLA
jgi:putative redox protein